jgi:hypothetical protein
VEMKKRRRRKNSELDFYLLTSEHRYTCTWPKDKTPKRDVTITLELVKRKEEKVFSLVKIEKNKNKYPQLVAQFYVELKRLKQNQ